MNADYKHNEVSMFKVGDFLVYKDSNKYKNCLFKVVDDEDAVAIAVEDGKECFVYFADMRLATKEEISAGHRIDCEILDHPEDYTPPNCKKFDEQVK